MKILFVGPGIMPIPSPGWGAVETVIWQLKIHLEKMGHTVDILNKRGIYSALKAKPWEYDVVHLQYDDLAGFWVRLATILKFKLLITSHYGYSAWPDKWHRSYKRIFKNLMRSPGLILLSQEIADLYSEKGYKGFKRVVPNGTEVDSIRFSNTSLKDLICLGKIEPRKRQTELSSMFSAQRDLHLDFVGHCIDKRFTGNNVSTHHIGSWTRDEVRNKLTDYKTLILLSDGEAHALVVGEALAAGLSLIITSEAAANLNRSLPFIKIVKKGDDIVSIAKTVCSENKTYRNEIRRYSEENFTWNITAERYIQAVNEYLRIG